MDDNESFRPDEIQSITIIFYSAHHKPPIRLKWTGPLLKNMDNNGLLARNNFGEAIRDLKRPGWEWIFATPQ